MKHFEMYAQLYDSQRRFSRACDQILLLNTKLSGLRKRYLSARSSDLKTFRFPLRMRILVLDGMVKRYYHYADMKRNEILELRHKLKTAEEKVDGNHMATDDEM